MIDLDEKSLQIVKELLRQHVPECKVLAFGSRVTGTASRYSDLDLAIVCSCLCGLAASGSIERCFL